MGETNTCEECVNSHTLQSPQAITQGLSDQAKTLARSVVMLLLHQKLLSAFPRHMLYFHTLVKTTNNTATNINRETRF